MDLYFPTAAAVDAYAVNNYIMPVDAAIANGLTLGVNTLYLYPFFLRRSAQISELGARVTTTVASSVFQLAVYENISGLPGPVLASTADISGASATALSSSITPLTLRAGQPYWYAVNSSISGLVFQAPVAASAYANSVIGTDSLSIVSSATTTVVWNRAYTQSYGTWPNLTGQTTTVLAATRTPSPILRVSALL